jgi:hypothetical protein
MKRRKCKRKGEHDPHEWKLDGLGYSMATGGMTAYRGKIPEQRKYWCTGNREQR